MRIDADIAETAALIGDPVRAAMLAALLDRTPLSAGQLAFAARVSPQAASFHLAKLTAAKLLKVERQGRHKVYALGSKEVATAIEALGVIATAASNDPSPPRFFQSEQHKPMRFARSCYDHLAGIVGVRFHDAMFDAGYLLKSSEQEYLLTDKGAQWLGSLAVIVPANSRSPLIRPCMDWSERRPHLAGHLASELLGLFFSERWISRIGDTRTLRITATGIREFQRHLGIDIKSAMIVSDNDTTRKSA